MNLPRLAPEDWQYIRKRLSRTVCLAVLMLVITVYGRCSNSLRTSSPDVSARVLAFETTSVSVLGVSSGPKSVPPEGWRRTAAGWQHVSTWPKQNDSINSLLATQKSREPAMVRRAVQMIGGLSPATFALMQILAIGLIAVFASRYQSELTNDG